MSHRRPIEEESAELAPAFRVVAREARATGLQRSMLLSSLKSEGGAYCQQFVVPLRDCPNESLFLRAVQLCLSRHAALMARFEFREGELYQSRLSEAEPPFAVVDLTSETGPSEQRLQRFLETDRLDPLPFLESKPLWRSRIVRLAPDDSVWVWTHHHSLCDAASYPLLLAEISQAYADLREGRKVSTTPAAPDFLDHLHSLGQRDWAAERQTWQRRLSRSDSPTALPEVRAVCGAQPLRSDARSHRIGVDLPLEVEERLRLLCVSSELTLNTLAIAACALWLARMQGESKAIFAAMRSARKSSIAGAEKIIGPFVNTVPLRIETPDDLSLGDWLRAVRRHWLELRALEQSSLAQIAEWTGFGTDNLELPLVLNFQRAALEGAQLFQANDVPLLVAGHESPRFRLELIGRKESVSPATLRATANGIGAALRAFAGDTSRPLGSIEMLCADDRAVLQRATRGPQIEVTAGPAQEMIERQIRTQPDGIAIEDGDHKVTFREFGEIAGRIAANLVALGGTGGIVAVLLPPSAEILCAILGSFRAGAAFLLINPELPNEERAAMLRRLPIALAIAAPGVAEETRAIVPRVVSFEEISSTSLARPGSAIPATIAPHDLAYLVHTSGSTGEKKFVEVEHHSLAETLSVMVRLYRYRPGDRRLSMGSPGNDYFIGELLVALSGGGTMIFPRRCGALSISDYLSQLDSERITVSGIPAAYWHEWVRSMPEDRAQILPAGLRLVICSMEKASPQLLAKWQCLVGERVRWLNVYGPAEATVAVTAWDPATSPEHAGNNVPIGRPFGNSEMYVLDRKQRRLPVGVCGEISIAGAAVARGYRDFEAATRAKFIPNPLAPSPEFARLYLTGDYGYLNERAEFVFLERRDRQVKIRGYRVELGEIDVLLEEHEKIQHAVVTLEGMEGDQYLVAHVVPNGVFDQREMLDWMRTRLPAQMRPADFVVLAEMPLMPTGKVDRKQLSQTYRTRPAPAEPYDIDATDPAESILLSLWRELLGRHVAIGRSDSFFDLGGNSLLAIRFLARLQNDFGFKLSVHDLFSHPTIEALARLIGPAPAEKKFTSLTPLNNGGPGPNLFIVHGWAGGVFHCLDFARRLGGVRPVVGLQAVELAGQERHETFEEMAAHYADEILRFKSGGPFELLGHSLGGMIAYATACELQRRGYAVERLYVVDTTPFNLPRWVHAWHVAGQLRPTVLPHLKSFVQTWPRYWPRFLRARRRSLKARMRRWPAAASAGQKPLPPDADYYLRVLRAFVPRRESLEVRLFTPDSSRSTDTYWKYLTRGRVKKYPINCGHVDMFTPQYLDNLMQAFAQASRES